MAGLNKKVLIAAVAVVVVAALLIGLILYVRNVTSSLHITAAAHREGALSATSAIRSTGALTYGNATGLVGYAIVDYAFANVSNATFSLSIYKSNPDFRIYLVNVSDYCYDCFDEQLLVDNMSGALAGYGLLTNQSTFSFVNIGNISSIPRDSVVVIPSGLLPTPLVPSSNSTGLLALLNKGDTVFYIGQNFSRSISTDGIIFSTSQQSLNALMSYGIATVRTNSTLNNGVKSANNFTFSNATFGFAGGHSYGSVTYASAGNGTLLAFSNYEKAGWRNVSSEATDIAKAVEARFWMPKIASGSFVLAPGQYENSSIGVFSTAAYPQYSNASMQEMNGSYVFVKMLANNATAGTIQNLYSNVVIEQNGTLSMPGSIAQTQSVPIQVSMNVAAGTAQSVSPHIDIYTRNMSYVATIPIGFFNTSTSLNIIKYTSFSLPSGTYVAVLRNFYNRYYSAALFQMGNVTISPVLLSFSNSTFVFSVKSNNYPISNSSYSVELNGGYNYSGTVSNGRIYYSLPKGTVIPYGDENFTFRLFNTRYVYSQPYIKKIFHIPAFYIEFAVIAVVVIMLNLLLRAPTRDEYYIDVQDFPAAKKARVKTTEDQIVNAFDRVNLSYHWHYMPLTLEEVKNGIGSTVRYNNMPVSITLQNTEELLGYLAEKGSIVSAENYYAPKKWIANSKHDIEYLSIFRKLRDYSIAHAMLFTDIDGSDVADLVITKGGAKIYMVIYSGISGMRKLSLASGSKWYIVFLNDETKKEFHDKLYEAYGEQAEAMKMGLYNNYIKLVDTGDLDAVVV